MQNKIRHYQGPEFIDHCESYLFFMDRDLETFKVHAKDLNNYEKGLVFDYLYFLLDMKAKKGEEGHRGFFPAQVFMVMITSQVYDHLKKAGNPQDIDSFEEAVLASAKKVWQLREWHEAGQPQDDKNILDEMAQVMLKGQQNRFESIMKLLEKNIRKGKRP